LDRLYSSRRAEHVGVDADYPSGLAVRRSSGGVNECPFRRCSSLPDGIKNLFAFGDASQAYAANPMVVLAGISDGVLVIGQIARW